MKGELVEDASVQRSVPVECLQWHPVKVIMAIGWRSGEITLYNESEHESFEQSSLHRKPLVFLVWNSSGSRLISGDKVESQSRTVNPVNSNLDRRNLCLQEHLRY